VAVDTSEQSPSCPPPGIVLVRMPTEVDLATAPALRDELLRALDRDGVHLVVDALDVTFMDSSGVNALVRAREHAAALDGSLHVVTGSPGVRRVLQITGLGEQLGLVDSMEAAFACASDPASMHTCCPGG
jgi:stage II sporulation protein AA (anti-sigma F factor antagonist)